MTNEILTPISLWADFNDALPLKERKVNVVSIGMVDYNYIYFSGRETSTSRVRIYGLYAKQKAKSKGSMLILPNVSDKINEDLVNYYVKQGYDVLYVDLAGEVEGRKNYTKYPADVSYANFLNCNENFYNINNTAKETCWYEWVAVGRYAVSFLQKQNPKKPIFALGIKHGANVLWQLAGVDKRISSAIFLFGAGWLSYNGIDKHDEKEIEMDDNRIRFLAGVDAHTYAKHVTCPVMFLGTTNSVEFNVERAVDTLSYLDSQKKTHFNFSASSVDVLDGNYLKTIDIFLNKYVLKEKIALPEYPQLDLDVKGDVIWYNISYSLASEVESVCVYTSFDDVNLNTRVWNKCYLPLQDSGEIEFENKIVSSFNSVLAFVEVVYKNGFRVCSKFFYKNSVYESNVVKPKVLFNTDKYLIEFVSNEVNDELLAKVFTKNSLNAISVGPNDIKGVTSINSLSTYAIRNFVPNITDNSFIKFDVYSRDFLKLTLSILVGEKAYSYTAQLSGGEIWQNVIIDFQEFKDENGVSIDDYQNINLLTFKSVGKFTLNNVMVLW